MTEWIIFWQTLLVLVAALLEVPQAEAQGALRVRNRTRSFVARPAVRRVVARNRLRTSTEAVVTVPTTEATTTTTTTTTVAPEIVTEDSFADFTDAEADFTDAFTVQELTPTPAPVAPIAAPALEKFDELVQRLSERLAEPETVIQVESEPIVAQEPIRQQQRRPITRPRTTARPLAARQQQVVESPETAPAPAEPVVKVLNPKIKTRVSVKQEERKPVVETVRRYSFESDDGSFTWGYENADGSFKEETRGADCVVRGKYGYVDPEGVKREFTYEQGNPCNRDAEQESESDEESEEESEEQVVAVRRPTRPNIPQRATFVNTPRPRPAAPSFAFDASEEQEEEVNIAPVPVPERTRIRLPQNLPRERPAAPAAVPVRASVPSFVQNSAPIRSSPAPAAAFDFASEVERLSASVPARPASQPTRFQVTQNQDDTDDDDDDDDDQNKSSPVNKSTGNRSFSSELVFDRDTNQFRTAFRQRIPEEGRDVSFSENLDGFVPFSSTTAAPTTSRAALAAAVATTAAPAPTPAPTPAPRPVAIAPASTFRQSDLDLFNSFGPSVDGQRAQQQRFQLEEQQRRQQEETRRLQEEQLRQQAEARRVQEQQQQQLRLQQK